MPDDASASVQRPAGPTPSSARIEFLRQLQAKIDALPAELQQNILQKVAGGVERALKADQASHLSTLPFARSMPPHVPAFISVVSVPPLCMRPSPSEAPQTLQHFYLLRLNGVRCERHLGVLCEQRLPPAAELAPLFIYPHGVTQFRVELEYQGERELTDNEVRQAVFYHASIFAALYPTLDMEPMRTLYVMVACMLKSPAELDRQEEHWRRVDENEEREIKREHPADAPYRVCQQLLSDAALRAQFVERPLTSDPALPSAPSISPAMRVSQRCEVLRDGFLHDKPIWTRRYQLEPWATPHALANIPVLLRIIAEYDPAEPPADVDWAAMDNFGGDTFALPEGAFPIVSGEMPDFQRSVLEASLLDLMEDAKHGRRRGVDGAFPLHLETAIPQPRSILLKNPATKRLYLYLSTSQLTPRDRFPNPEYGCYEQYFRQRYPRMGAVNPFAPLLAAADFTFTPLPVLQPHTLPLKKLKAADEQQVMLLQEVVYRRGSAEWMSALRMMPAILHQLECNVRQWEWAHETLRVPLNPSALRMALTAGNAQQSYPLKPIDMPLATEYDRLFASVPQAMVHSYERLKFIGDSILKLITCKLLLRLHPNDAEESLTRRKAVMLSVNRLAAAGMSVDLQHVIVTHPYQPTQGIPASFARELRAEISKHVVADVVASVIGAAWFSGGERTCIAVMCAFGLIEQQQLVLEDINEYPLIAKESLSPPSAGLALRLYHQDQCEAMFGYKFNNQALFIQAFTHGSWERRDTFSTGDPQFPLAPLPSFERLELLGDAVLELCASTFLYHSLPYCATSHELNVPRQKLVCNETLARVVCDQQLHHMLMHTSLPLAEAIRAYEAQLHAPRPLYSTLSSSAARVLPPPKLLADMLESLLGAVYVDSGFQLQPVWSVFCRLLSFGMDNHDDPATLKIHINGGTAVAEDPRERVAALRFETA